MIIAVTGHRPDKLEMEFAMNGPVSKFIYTELEKKVKQLKPELMITGMALGVDMIWACVAINHKIPFAAAIPFEGQELKWPEKSQRTYRKILSLASQKYVICDGGYAAWKMQKRNEWMVDRCDLLIAVWDGSKGGTANCVKYAQDSERAIKYIDPMPKRFHIKGIHPESDDEWFDGRTFHTLEEAEAYILTLPAIDEGHGYYDVIDTLKNPVIKTDSSLRTNS